MAPGYYFYAPFSTGEGAAPCIFDQEGVSSARLSFDPQLLTSCVQQLVWWGAGHNYHAVKDFQVCDHAGSIGTHLCWAEFSFSALNQERSKNRIFDNTYTSVGREYSTIGDFNDPNPHEFNMLPGGRTFLQAIYQMKRWDLTAYLGPHDGYIVDGCFQEVDVFTGRPVFSWCALDHLHLDETLLYMNIKANTMNYTESIAGEGVPTIPWDWFHFNAVDKNEEGDYLISARHLSQILKVAGKENNLGLRPGTIIWRLNNKGNMFDMRNEDGTEWSFSRQHHVRYISTSANETKLALFNNGWSIRNREGFTNHSSSGQVITINNSTWTATLDADYVHPYGGLSIASGSMHVNPENSNAVVGWGTLPEISEYHADGRLLFHMHFNEHGLNYRAFKFSWVGNPQTPPKLLAYSKSCETHGEKSPLMAYVSWNGATEVASWRFYVSTTSRTGPWLPAGTFQKEGFETKANLTSSIYTGFAKFAPYVSVEALDANGNVLGSTVTDTFVPRPDYAICGVESCLTPHFKYREDQSCGKTCGRNLTPAILVLCLVIVGIESFNYLSHRWWDRAVRINEIGHKILDRELSAKFFAGMGTEGGLEGFTEKRPYFGLKRARSGYERPGKKTEMLKSSGIEV